MKYLKTIPSAATGSFVCSPNIPSSAGNELSVTNASLDTATMKIVIIKKPLNNRPVLDSIKVDSVIYDSIARAQGGSSITLKAYAHDPDGLSATQKLTYEWQSKVSGRIQSQSASQATYVSLTDPYTDTVTVKVTDTYGFFDRDTIILSINLPPVIDSLEIGSTVYNSPIQSHFTLEGTRNDTLRIVTHARDPEEKDINIKWTAKVSIMRKVDDSTYECSSFDQEYADTLNATITDADGFYSEQSIFLNIKNNRPVIDSLVTTSETFLKISSGWSLSATVLDSITMTVYTSDPDDNLASRSWELPSGSSGTLNILNPLKTQARYICKDSIYKDTVIVQAVDTKGATGTRRLIVDVNNRPPSIDSIKVDTAMYRVRTAADSVFTYTKDAPASFYMQAWSHDPDGDAFTTTWLVGEMNAIITSYPYQGRNEAYTDTVTVTVEDENNTSISKKILLIFE